MIEKDAAMKIGNGIFYHGDCFDVMRTLPDGIVDMILCDLPYGTTACKWDSVLPFDALWSEYWRLCRGAVVLTASQPFTSALVMSQADFFKYSWIWEKSKASNFLSAKKQPLKNHEDVVVFARGAAPYHPQMVEGEAYAPRPGKKITEVYNPSKDHMHRNGSDGRRYPKSVQYFKTAESEGSVFHPTQKPVELFEYMIRTYTNPSDTVLDNTAGSGTTAIAAENTGRKWICIERDDTYYAKAVERVRNHLGMLA
jgi:DNA modification methylase